MSTVHLLIGPAAGRGRADGVAATVERTIRSEGHDPVDITGPDLESSRRAVTEAVTSGARRVIVVGGDGMVHLALQALAGTDTALGVVPVGTGNDFARAFGVDENAPAADATRRALGPASPVDAIHSDRGWVASVATAGFSGDVNERANHLRRPKGPKRYTVATLMEIPRLRSREVRLVVDGRPHELEVALLAVANTAWFGGGMQICPDARPDDGRIDMTVVGSIGRLALLRYFPLVFSGAHIDHPSTSTYQGRTISVEGDDLDVWGDGEPLGAGSITFTAVPAAVNLSI